MAPYLFSCAACTTTLPDALAEVQARGVHGGTPDTATAMVVRVG